MSHSPDELLDVLRQLELELHRSETRADQARVEALLHPQFEEIGCSGRRYDKAAALRTFASEVGGRQIHADSFSVCEISDGTALLTYRSTSIDGNGGQRHEALRSSLWLKTPSGWRLRYHQGTLDNSAAETGADGGGNASHGILDWDELAAGRGCFFDQPRPTSTPYWDAVATLSVSTLCLLKNQVYKGHCILIYDPRHAVRPDQLSLEEWLAFSSDAHRATEAIISVCRPDHVNLECIGNHVPHLHWQIIPRYKDDPRWGGPIWTSTIEEQRELELPKEEGAALFESLRRALE